MSAKDCSILFVLWAAIVFTLSGCTAPPSQLHPAEQETATLSPIPIPNTLTPTAIPNTLTPITIPNTLTPLSIPKSMGLPQPQSQRASTPPAPHAVTPEAQSPSQLLQDQALPPGAPVPQVAWLDIVGIWESQEETAYGTVYSQVILERTGTYSLQAWWLDLLAYETGTYYVGDGFIHFMLDNYEPKIYKGRWMSRPMSWTAWYTIIDANTMVWEDRIIHTQWTVYRQ